jgi:hypothetical protein
MWIKLSMRLFLLYTNNDSGNWVPAAITSPSKATSGLTK